MASTDWIEGFIRKQKADYEAKYGVRDGETITTMEAPEKKTKSRRASTPEERARRAAYYREYRKRNKERLADYDAAYRNTRRDQIRKAQQAYYQRNREAIIAKVTARKAAQKEEQANEC